MLDESLTFLLYEINLRISYCSNMLMLWYHHPTIHDLIEWYRGMLSYTSILISFLSTCVWVLIYNSNKNYHNGAFVCNLSALTSSVLHVSTNRPHEVFLFFPFPDSCVYFYAILCFEGPKNESKYSKNHFKNHSKNHSKNRFKIRSKRKCQKCKIIIRHRKP